MDSYGFIQGTINLTLNSSIMLGLLVVVFFKLSNLETRFPQLQRGAVFMEQFCFYSVSPCWKHYTCLLLKGAGNLTEWVFGDDVNFFLDRKSLCAATGVI